VNEYAQAYEYCRGDERQAVALVALNKDRIVSLNTPEAEAVLSRVKAVTDGRIQLAEAGPLEAEMKAHLPEDHPIWIQWAMFQSLSQAEESNSKALLLAREELADRLGASHPEATKLASAMVAAGFIKTAGYRKKPGAKGTGKLLYAFDEGLPERIAEAFRAVLRQK
jgi:hypothetical protein